MDSKLQIISGIYRGRRLNLPIGARPTQNRARIALFNILQSLGISPRVVWDAFAGSGAFGIECLSRFADARVVFTDVAPATVRKNLGLVDADTRGSVVVADAVAAAEKYGASADLIFLDPPYADGTLGDSVMRRITPIAKTGTVVVWEQEAGTAHRFDESVWDVLRDRTYGRARFLVLCRK